MKLKYIVPFLFLVLCFTSCLKCFCEDEKLSLIKTDQPNNVLKFKGFYYGNKYVDYKGNVTHDVFILYKSGALLYPGAYSKDKFDMVRSIIENVNEVLCGSKFNHGLVSITDGKIDIEYWEPSQCSRPTEFRTGTILNDSTFTLSKTENSASGISPNFKFVAVDSVAECTNSFN